MPKLHRKTKNLIVRPLRKNDYTVWKDCFSTMDSSQNPWDVNGGGERTLTKAAFNRQLRDDKKQRDADSFYRFSVFEKKSGALVGGVSAMNVVRGVTHMAFLGYWMHNRFWGRGYGKESVCSMLDLAFKGLKLHRMEAGVEPYNRRSIMLARSVGLRKEGLKKRLIFLRGEWQDAVIYSATCEDFGIKWRGQIG